MEIRRLLSLATVMGFAALGTAILFSCSSPNDANHQPADGAALQLVAGWQQDRIDEWSCLHC